MDRLKKTFGDIRLLAFDLDGTLLDDQKRLGASIPRAVAACREAGVQSTLITGRTWSASVAFARQLNIELPIVALNGSTLRDGEGTILHEAALAPDRLRDLIDMTRGNGARPFLFTRENILLPERSRSHMIYLKYWGILENAAIVENFGEETKNALQLHLIGKRNALEDLKARCDASWPGEFEFFLFPSLKLEEWHMEARAAGFNKKAGLEILLRKLNLTWQNVMAFGDWRNDLEILSAAGLAVAPANAESCVKDAAALILELDNNQDAVGRFLEKSFLPVLTHLNENKEKTGLLH